MSGNAASKQMSTPIGSGRPPGRVAVITRAPVPGSMLTGAALLILVTLARALERRVRVRLGRL